VISSQGVSRWSTGQVSVHGREFARHYHEDMQEIFICCKGEAEITVGNGDRHFCVVAMRSWFDPREVHQMRNVGREAVE